MNNRRRILLPGEKHPPAAPPMIVCELHGIREHKDAAGNQAIGLIVNQSQPGRNYEIILPVPSFFHYVESWLKHLDCRIESNRISPVQNFRNALDAIGMDWDANVPLVEVLGIIDQFFADRVAQQQANNKKDEPDG